MQTIQEIIYMDDESRTGWISMLYSTDFHTCRKLKMHTYQFIVVHFHQIIGILYIRIPIHFHLYNG